MNQVNNPTVVSKLRRLLHINQASTIKTNCLAFHQTHAIIIHLMTLCPIEQIKMSNVNRT